MQCFPMVLGIAYYCLNVACTNFFYLNLSTVIFVGVFVVGVLKVSSSLYLAFLLGSYAAGTAASRASDISALFPS